MITSGTSKVSGRLPLRKGGFAACLDDTLSHLVRDAPVKNRPRLLLHACCAPCSSHVLDVLCPYFDIALFWYNPNIHPASEHQRRYQELEHFLDHFPPATQNRVKLVCAEYNPDEYFDAVDTAGCPDLVHEKERGERCARCYKLRLSRTFCEAHNGGYDWFCTTLSVSPHKDALMLNQIGSTLCATEDKSPQWLYSDFKKKDGFLHSLHLSEQYGLFRQSWCGCVYSQQHR